MRFSTENRLANNFLVQYLSQIETVHSLHPFSTSPMPSCSACSLPLALALLLLTGCATSYKNINPDQLNPSTTYEAGDYVFAYQYDVLDDAGNGRYAKKARKAGLFVVGVSVTNHSDAPLTLTGQRLSILANGVPLQPVNPSVVADQVKQPTVPYLLWGLLTVFITKDDNINDNEDPKVTVIPIGIPIALINMLIASGANSSAEKNFRGEALYGQTVQPGETISGLVYLRDVNYAPLEFQVQ